MDASITKPLFEELAKATKVLIALPQQLQTDNTASGIALALFLRKMGKEVTVASAGAVPQELSFLPTTVPFEHELGSNKNFIIRLSTKEAAVSEISYHADPEALNIYVKPKSGSFRSEDVSFVAESSSFSLIIIIDSMSLESLGSLFEQNTELFFNTPKVNIDNHPGNQYFGAINIVDMNAGSIAEILADVFEASDKSLIDEDIATCLLTGIIEKTNSFQHTQTTPHAFVKASELLALGGRQQDIVRALYKTKPLSLLKLWGRALARLQTLGKSGVMYSVLNKSDFEKSDATAADLPGVLKELLENISGYDVVLVLAETETGTACFIASQPHIDIKKVAVHANIELASLPISSGSFATYQGEFVGISLTEAEVRLRAALE